MIPLDEYEAGQADEIAAWKSERPSLVMAAFRGISRPLSRLASKVVPEATVRSLVEKAEHLSERFGGQEEVARRAGIRDIRELRTRTLAGVRSPGRHRQCPCRASGDDRGGRRWRGRGDHRDHRMCRSSWPRRSGPLPGSAIATAIRSTPRSTGSSCSASSSSRPSTTPRDASNCFRQLRDLGAGPLEGEAAAPRGRELGDVRGPGRSAPCRFSATSPRSSWITTSSAGSTSRPARVFQERWLKDRGKLDEIFPAPESRRRSSLEGGADLLAQMAYVGSYGIAFGITLPLAVIAQGAASYDNSLVRGCKQGARHAAEDADRFLDRIGGSSDEPEESPPSLAVFPAA